MAKAPRGSSACAVPLLVLLAMCSLTSTWGVLLDRGPISSTLVWPTWYRDTKNTAVKLCQSTQPTAGPAYCFPVVPLPGYFAGNVGDEIFYFNMQAVYASDSSINLRYIAALEAAYANGPPIHGDEMVFSRIRIIIDVNNETCGGGGTYKVEHPYGVEEFPDVFADARAITYTNDVGIVAGAFDDCLKGTVGPFLRWANADGTESQLLTAGGDTFLGDPNTPHLYTGSPIDFNMVRVTYTAPADTVNNCNLDGLGNSFVEIKDGFILGQVYTNPIADPVQVLSASYSMATDADGMYYNIDVEAQGTVAHKLVLSHEGGTGLTTFPTTLLTEGAPLAGGKLARYHAHVRSDSRLPSVFVLDTTSVPPKKVEKDLTDVIHIIKAVYNPENTTLCVEAYSSGPSTCELSLDKALGADLKFQPVDCSNNARTIVAADGTQYNVLSVNKGSAVTDGISPLNVYSSCKGVADLVAVEFLPSHFENTPAPLPVANGDEYLNVGAGAPTTLSVGSNDAFPGVSSGTWPSTATIFIVDQPEFGSVSVVVSNNQQTGKVLYTPDTSGTVLLTVDNEDQYFTYLVQYNGKFSVPATVHLKVTHGGDPPATTPDQFAVYRTRPTTLDVLFNDAPSGANAGSTITINAATLKIETKPAGSGNTATVSNGKVVFTGSTTGADFFEYSVQSSAGVVSAFTRVNVNVASSGEILSATRARYQPKGLAWSIDFADSAGWIGATNVASFVLTPTLYCFLVRNQTASNTIVTLTTPAYIGSAIPVSGTTTWALTAAAGQPVVDHTGKQWVTAKGPSTKGWVLTVQCATSNHVSAFPQATSGTLTLTSPGVDVLNFDGAAK